MSKIENDKQGFLMGLLTQLLSLAHGFCAQVYWLCLRLASSGWYEALEHTEDRQSISECPVMKLVNKTSIIQSGKVSHE